MKQLLHISKTDCRCQSVACCEVTVVCKICCDASFDQSGVVRLLLPIINEQIVESKQFDGLSSKNTITGIPEIVPKRPKLSNAVNGGEIILRSKAMQIQF
jgi:hypothetical protein